MLIFLLLLGAQVLVPAVLIVLQAAVRPGSWPALVLRTLALLLMCAFLGLAGFWAFPPWWTPHAFGALALAASGLAAWRLARARRRGHGPAGGVRRFGEALVALAVGALSALGVAAAVGGRHLPEGAVDIAFPLEPGRYLVVNGGHHPILNAHFMTLENPAYADWRGQSFAVDLIAIDRRGWRATAPLGTDDPADYHIFGRAVLAPCDGVVTHAVGDRIDHRVPELDAVNRGGNELMIDCGDFLVYLAHLREGSLRVAVGDTVAAGDRLAEVGNSGHSGEPHLHVHAQRAGTEDAPLAGAPLPVTFDGRFPVRNARLAGG